MSIPQKRKEQSQDEAHWTKVAARRGDRVLPLASVNVDSGDLGLGLFARSPIRDGQRIVALTGPVITFDAAKEKGERESFTLQVSGSLYVDLDAPGCYANHSCSPNAGVSPDLWLIAVSDIGVGEEVRYDYSTTMDEDFWTMACRCGTSACRGRVRDFKTLPKHIIGRYLELNIVAEFIEKQYRGVVNART